MHRKQNAVAYVKTEAIKRKNNHYEYKFRICGKASIEKQHRTSSRCEGKIIQEQKKSMSPLTFSLVDQSFLFFCNTEILQHAVQKYVNLPEIRNLYHMTTYLPRRIQFSAYIYLPIFFHATRAKFKIKKLKLISHID